MFLCIDGVSSSQKRGHLDALLFVFLDVYTTTLLQYIACVCVQGQGNIFVMSSLSIHGHNWAAALESVQLNFHIERFQGRCVRGCSTDSRPAGKGES